MVHAAYTRRFPLRKEVRQEARRVGHLNIRSETMPSVSETFAAPTNRTKVDLICAYYRFRRCIPRSADGMVVALSFLQEIVLQRHQVLSINDILIIWQAFVLMNRAI